MPEDAYYADCLRRILYFGVLIFKCYKKVWYSFLNFPHFVISTVPITAPNFFFSAKDKKFVHSQTSFEHSHMQQVKFTRCHLLAIRFSIHYIVFWGPNTLLRSVLRNDNKLSFWKFVLASNSQYQLFRWFLLLSRLFCPVRIFRLRWKVMLSWLYSGVTSLMVVLLLANNSLFFFSTK